jgi:hypothetical protein
MSRTWFHMSPSLISGETVRPYARYLRFNLCSTVYPVCAVHFTRVITFGSEAQHGYLSLSTHCILVDTTNGSDSRTTFQSPEFRCIRQT